MPSSTLPVPPPPKPRSFLLGLACSLVLAVMACQTAPTTVPQVRREPPALQDPTWFGEGVQLVPSGTVDFAWAPPNLDLRGQAIELAAWEVPATPPQGGEASKDWRDKRERVTQLLQAFTTEGIALAQQMTVPVEVPAAYRVQGRILSFDRQARVAEKAGQFLGNIVLVPVNLAVLLATRGAMFPPFFIGRVSGYRTEVLCQVKVVDLVTQRTVLGLQSWLDFKSLETPARLQATLWKLCGGEAMAKDWWPSQKLQRQDGDEVWFQPGLDLSRASIRCLRWLPGPSLQGVFGEGDLERRLQANRMPSLLAEPQDDETGPFLSETKGSLYLQVSEPWAKDTCWAKLWDPATGQVLGLMEVTKGFWSSDKHQDWARRIRRHLRAQRGSGTPP